MSFPAEATPLFHKLLNKPIPHLREIRIFTGNIKEEFERFPQTLSQCWLPLKTIREEKKFNELYQANITLLMKEFVAWKKSRGDGNCYYRSVIASFVIKILHPRIQHDFLANFLNLMRSLMQNLNAQEDIQIANAIYNFFSSNSQNFDSIDDRVRMMINLHESLQDYNFDQCLIRVARLISMKALMERAQDDNIAPFLLDGEYDVCMKRINQMGVEAEGLDLILLPLGLGIQVTQINMFDGIVKNCYPENDSIDDKLNVNIICKSRGHYDIIYSKKELEFEQCNLKNRAYYYY